MASTVRDLQHVVLFGYAFTFNKAVAGARSLGNALRDVSYPQNLPNIRCKDHSTPFLMRGTDIPIANMRVVCLLAGVSLRKKGTETKGKTCKDKTTMAKTLPP